jgi:ribosomal protein S27E
MENKLDGNAAAGMLQEIFPFEMTLAQVTCTGCGTTNVIGATAAYMHGMGTIIRCPMCDNVLIRIVQARGRSLLDMRGVRVLEMKEG